MLWYHSFPPGKGESHKQDSTKILQHSTRKVVKWRSLTLTPSHSPGLPTISQENSKVAIGFSVFFVPHRLSSTYLNSALIFITPLKWLLLWSGSDPMLSGPMLPSLCILLHYSTATITITEKPLAPADADACSLTLPLQLGYSLFSPSFPALYSRTVPRMLSLLLPYLFFFFFFMIW